MFWRLLLVFLVSMVPVIELRGAVPIGVGLGLPEWLTLVVAIIGNMLPVPVIYLFSRKILEWGADLKIINLKPRKIWQIFQKFCRWVLKKGNRAGQKILKKTGGSLFFALFLFVGIPLPGTGAWTGTLAASLLNLDFEKTVGAVLCGVLLAGAIMLSISMGVFQILF